MAAVPWTVRPDGLVVEVRLTPRAAMDRIDGVEILSDGAPVLKTRVRAVPEKGKANEAALALLAKAAGVPVSRAELISGDSARRKIIRLAGDGAALASTFAALVAAKG